MAPVDQVRAELNLKAPTPQTLRYLRAALGLGYHDECEGNSQRTETKKVPQTKGALRSRPPLRATTKQRQKQAARVQIHESTDPRCVELSHTDREKLATETFNLTLRHLGDAVKGLKGNDKSVAPHDSASRPGQPDLALQERSPNKGGNTTTTITKEHLQSSRPPDLAMVVECCQSALHCLRRCGQEATDSDNTKASGVERAALVLLDRSISLGLAGHATSQLVEIQQRHRRCHAKEIPPSGSRLAELLLGRPDAIEVGSIFDFTVSMQGQALRLALLVGHKCINPELVRSLRPDTPGSPSWIIIQGFRQGRTTSEQAVIQLRTLALTLHKLYLQGMKPSTDNTGPVDLFDLFCLSLHLKIESRTKGGAAIDSVSDIWQPYHRSFRKLSETMGDLSAISERIIESLTLFRTLLVDAKCKPEIPMELAETMLDVLQSSTGCAEILAIVEESLTTAASPSHVLHCQITVARLKNSSGNLKKTLSTVNGMQRMLSEGKMVSQVELSRLLFPLAQLRKAATALLPDRARKQIPDETVVSRELETSLISLVYALFLFLTRHVALALGPGTSPKTSNGSPFLVTFAKTVEALLSIEHCTATHGPESAQAERDILKDCSVTVQELQTRFCSARVHSRDGALCNQLRLRISQRCWSRYLTAIKQHRPPQEHADILELSLQGLLDLPDSDQGPAITALKFEKLADSYLESRNYEKAANAFRNALAVGIRQGILSDIVESLLARSYGRAWSEDSSRKSFEKHLTTYARILHAHQLSGEAEAIFYDDQSLPAMHRAALVEKQMLAVFELEDDDRQINACTQMMTVLHNILGPTEYQVYLLRSVSYMLGVALKKRTPASMSIVKSAQVRSLLDRDIAAKESIFFKSFEPEIRSLVCLQHGFLTGWPHYQEFKKAFEHLSNHARSLKTLGQSRVDVNNYVAPLLLAVDFASINEDSTSALEALETLEHLARLGVDDPALCSADILVQKCNFYLQQRKFESAGLSLAMAEKTSGGSSMEPLVELDFSLAYSEHHLQLLRLEDCQCWLLRAKSAWERQVVSTKASSTRTKLKEQSLLCRAAYVASQLSYQRRQLLEAIILARQAAKIAASIWSSVDRLRSSAAPSESTSLMRSETHKISVEFSKLDISCESASKRALTTISAAPYIPLCFAVFGHMAFLTSHCGIYQEATSFLEQALIIARKTSQSNYEAIALSELGLLHARAGRLNEARDVLSKSCQFEACSRIDNLRTLTMVNRSETYLNLGGLQIAHQHLLEAKRVGAITVNNDKKASIGQIRRGKTTKSVAKSSAAKQRAAKTSEEKLLNETIPPSSSTVVATLEQTNLEARITALDARFNLREGVTTPDWDASGSNGNKDGPRWIPVALGLVHSAMKLLSEDAVHSVLAETAVALPVRYRSARHSGRVSFIQPTPPTALVSTKGRPTKQKLESVALRNGNALLLQAYDILQKLSESETDHLSSDLIHTCHKISTKITLLATALNQPLVPSSINLVSDITRPLDLARLREDAITLGELTASRRTCLREWPSPDRIDQISRFSDLEVVNEVDMGNLPASWSIVCVEVSEDLNELFVARLTRESSPFVVRIPLARPDPSATDVDELSLESAKAEMSDIILNANTTAHDARGTSADKSTRAAWLAERQALDNQLSTLLDSIENTWFGGFRGLLSAPRRNQDRLLDFGQRLQSTLNNHLPSRQKTARPSSAIIHLHDHVLELFVGLGHPQEADLEDAVTDLLYFVIDILQFNGERNAYDEIDFDAMLIEVLDAMHAYHDGMVVTENKDDHLILVLDKELQTFPWESLPCLRGQAVSRMPALGAIWERLKHMREQSHGLDAYAVSKTKGAYILNPSSDLKSTQDTFGELFARQLPDYTAIISRPPTTQEFETVLKEQDLVLYFGHGGGGQYIRPRTIRKMDSSAKLTEWGVFEPSGMPLSYLSGGSPAIVGTLWDVTDRDIDRFTLELMEDWGLLDGNSSSGAQAAKKAGHSKSKTGRARERQRRRPVSLDQAVAVARDACLLKYLNGAAPVMYGVPVILK
ncbi:separin protein [Cladophialophora chaetospira]|uniref:separase n=1 Tax=Cladophialophora chaetospira TaxID=386627 RepID=A0AA38XLS1_9EURO|nr:separin protein [Cladophialophora chaetospira]